MGNKTGLAAVSYILGLITGVIVLLAADKKDKFSRYHAMQSILFNLTIWVIAFVLALVTAPFAMVGGMTGMIFPLLMFGALSIVWMVYGVAVFLLWLFLILKAYSGQKYRLPMLGDWSEKLTK
jgi:uncharacterized membrane protein